MLSIVVVLMINFSKCACGSFKVTWTTPLHLLSCLSSAPTKPLISDCLNFFLVSLQRHQAYRCLFDWSPEENYKQHTVPAPAASPHPTEWLPSVRPLHKDRLCVLHTELEEFLCIVIRLIAQTPDC